MTDTRTFRVIVLESNTPPTLAVIPNRVIAEGTLLTFTNLAADADLPAQRLTFSLGASGPAGATLNPTNGVFTWQPSGTQGGTTNLLRVTVTDDGSPPLSATQAFTVIVRDTLPDFTLALGSVPLRSGAAGQVPLTLHSGII